MEEYLDLNGLIEYKQKSGVQYSAADPAADWYKKTRQQLYELIGEFEKRSGEKYQLVYKERPNAQAGRSKVVFKDYVLAGFAPQELNQGMGIFIKLALAHLGESPFFGIDVDVNFKDPNNPYNAFRDEMQVQSAYRLPIDDNFPTSWNALVDKIYPSFLKAHNIYRNYVSKVQEEKKAKNRMVWLYSPGEKANKWDEFHEKGIMALPYDQLGDLSEFANKEEVINAVLGLEEDEGYPKNKILACYEFANYVNIGDIVIAKKGKREYIGYGIVDSEYYFDESENSYRSRRKVIWKKRGEWYDKKGDIAVKTLTNITKYLKYVERLASLIEIDELDYNSKNTGIEMNLNRILYGPPGTGKTYSTLSHAVAIIEGKQPAELPYSREELRKRYYEYAEAKRIDFVTFHQSLAYEDFVEGIKPELNESENDFGYQLVDGIFKKMCANAKKSLLGVSVSKQEDLMNAFVEHMGDQIDRNGELVRKSKSGYDVRITEVTDNGKFTIVRPSLKNTYVYADKVKELDAKFDTMDDIELVHNSLMEFVSGAQTYYWVILKEFKEFKEKNKVDISEDNDKKRFVLVIDEINRGNVSAIFGELITLLEPDKREGENESLVVTLPYSKKPFSVPNNLYIIGTMNTADRSVEALDTALRRRFEFTEMMPDYQLEELDRAIEGIHLGNLLKTINERIEVLKDRDHLIGHSYLMSVQDEQDLASAFNQKIIPLLKEYFYGDFGQIGLVLGKGFIDRKDQKKIAFAHFSHEAIDDFRATPIYSFQEIGAHNIIEACNKLLGLKPDKEETNA